MLINVTEHVHSLLSDLFLALRDGLAWYIVRMYRKKHQKEYKTILLAEIKDIDRRESLTETFEHDRDIIVKFDLGCWIELARRNKDWIFEDSTIRIIQWNNYLGAFKDTRNPWAHQGELDAAEVARASEAALYILNALPDAQKYAERVREISAQLQPTPEVTEPTAVEHEDTSRLQPINPLRDEYYIEIVQHDYRVALHTLAHDFDRAVVGRGVHSDVKLADTRVSRAHLLVTRTPQGKVQVVDLLSANGTQLEGKALYHNQSEDWSPGQTVVIGKTWLILRRGSPPSALVNGK